MLTGHADVAFRRGPNLRGEDARQNGEWWPCPRIMDIHEFLRHAGPHAVHTGSPGLCIYAEDPKIIIDCIDQFDLRLLSFKKETL